MYSLIKIELYKIFKQKRSYIGFAALIVIILLSHIAMIWEGQEMHDFITQNLSDAFIMQGNLVNGYLITYLVLNFLWVYVPLLIVLVTGDLISGEAQAGTFRIILTKPVSRAKIITAKYIAAMFYTFIFMVIFAVLSLGLGLWIFGKGDLMVIFGSVNIFSESDVLWRFVLAFTYGFISMCTVAALSLLLSSLSGNSLSPILSTMAIIIVFTFISSLNLGVLGTLNPYLFTSYLDTWQSLFSYDIRLWDILIDALILFIHSLVFYGLTIFIFRKKDILS
ncbi:MAG: ABC transporter permease subunit [Bacteroidales bacterium]|nr:ABC transporter permease subunit [Bacteroidales bacterium]